MNSSTSFAQANLNDVIEIYRKRLAAPTAASQSARLCKMLNEVLEGHVRPTLKDLERTLRKQLSNDSIRFVIIENVTGENAGDVDVKRYFIQIFLVFPNQVLSPLRDPYFLIEVEPVRKMISMYGVDEKRAIIGSCYETQFSVDSQITGRELVENFHVLYRNFLLYLFESASY